MNTCKTCKHWAKLKKNSGGFVGECCLIDTITMGKHIKGGAGLEVSIFVHDDSGLYCDLITGENFGCIHHANNEEGGQ